jgi:hypothetical protein
MNDLKKYINLTEEISKFVDNNEKYFKENVSRSVLENINEVNSKLKNNKYTVAVIAAMKAGKSTLFNAVLGEDILPNETNACTVAITEIKYSKENSYKIDKYYINGDVETICGDNREELQKDFLNDIRVSRKNGNVDLIEKYYIEHSFEALKDKKYNDVVENFTLIDTPGPNEAGNGDFDTIKLKETAYYQLRNADAIIFILDYQNYKSDTNANLLKDIFAGRDDLKEDSEKIFFVINRLDTRTAKDNSVGEIISNVREFVKFNTDNIINNPNIIGISALQAVYGRTIKNKSITDQNKEDCKSKYIYKYSKSVMIEDQEYVNFPKDDEFAELLINDSNITEFENKVIEDTFIKSSNKMLIGAKELIKGKLNLLNKEIQSQVLIQSKNIEELNAGIKESKLEIEELMLTTKSHIDSIRDKATKIMTVMMAKTSNVESELKNEIENTLSEYQDYYESTEQAVLNITAGNLNRDCQNTISNYVLKKQDEILRTYNQNKQKIVSEIYQAVNDISRRADSIIKTNLDIDIDTSSLINLDINNNISASFDISQYSCGEGNYIDSDEDFKRQVGRGMKGAASGATAGFAVAGPIGAVIGGIGGFLLGVGTYESKAVSAPVIQKYKLDTTITKMEIRTHIIDQAKELENSINEFFIKEKEANERILENLLFNYNDQVKKYLDNISNNYEEQKGQREIYITELNNLQDKVNNFLREI